MRAYVFPYYEKENVNYTKKLIQIEYKEDGKEKRITLNVDVDNIQFESNGNTTIQIPVVHQVRG